MTELVTPEGILCYSHLTHPDDKGKYRCEIVFPPDTEVDKLEALIEAGKKCCKDAHPKKKAKPGIILPDAFSKDDGIYEDAVGIIRPWSKPYNGECRVDYLHRRDLRQRLSSDEVRDTFYDGCRVRAIVKPQAYDVDGNYGTFWFLNSLLFMAEGERLATSSDASSAFASALGVELEEDVVDSLM